LNNRRLNNRRPNNGCPSNNGGPGRVDQRNRGASNGDGGSGPSLSTQERNELLATGKCFLCKEVGHLGRNCPK
jgi:hypothetical protein